MEEAERYPAKRRKTQLACNSCRARKTGCDGRRPCCTSCALRGWQTSCSYQEKPAAPIALTLEDIDKRLRRLESRGISAVDATANHQFIPNDPSSSIIASSPTRNIAPSRRPQHTSLLTPGITPGHETDGDQTVYGTPSNSAFARQLTSVILTGRDSTAVSNAAVEPLDSLGYVESHPCTIEYDLNDLRLPSRSLADSLLQCYWELFHPLFPILHRPTFEAAYQQVWEPTTASALHNKSLKEIVFYSTLNIVLALGHQRSEDTPLGEGSVVSDDFFRRSAKLISLDNLNTTSLAIVQLLLLRGTYLLYTTFADRCWNTVGVAIRAAQALGLQLDERTMAEANQLTREMRRRVWCSCMNLDWMTSITFGRPTIIPMNTPIPLPASIDDEHLLETGQGRQPAGTPSRLDFFIHALKLLEVRERLQNFEVCRPGAQDVTTNLEKDLGTVLDLNASLDRFCEELPPHLRLDEDSMAESGQTCFALQTRVIRARIMYTRLRILRPLIIAEAYRYLTSTTLSSTQIKTGTSMLSLKVWADMCRLCVSTAHDVLDELHKHLDHVNRTSPWHTLYFTFAAASVLVAGSLCPYLDTSLDTGRGNESWNKAMEIFRFHKYHVVSADKGIDMMKRLKKSVEARQLDAQSGSISNQPQPCPLIPGLTSVSTPRPPDNSFDSNILDMDLVGFDEILNSTLLDEHWLTSQDFGVNDWMIHLT